MTDPSQPPPAAADQGHPSEGGHRLVIDHFEGDLAVVEVDGELFLDLPRWLLPDGVREGDVVVASSREAEPGGRVWELQVDQRAAALMRDEACTLLARLQRRDSPEDLEL